MPATTGSNRFRRKFKRKFTGGKRPVRQYQLRRAFRRFNRRIPKPQRKYLDTGSGDIVSIPTTSYVGIFALANTSTELQAGSAVDQGTGASNIIGYKGVWKGMKYRLSMVNEAQVLVGGQFMRVIHFFWKPNEFTVSGSPNAPLVSQILQQNDQTGSLTGYLGSYLSPYNVQWGKCYKIISDKTYALSTQGYSSCIVDKGNKKLHKTFQLNQPGSSEGIYDWSPWVMFISSTNTDASQPFINYYSRMSYVNT